MDHKPTWRGIGPARTRHLGDQVYESLSHLIQSGELAVGERLASEAELCRHFEVSRPVVRTALSRLREEGLIVSRKGSGSYVTLAQLGAEVQEAALSQLQTMLRALEYRRSIEPDAARLAAIRCGRPELDALEAALESFRSEPGVAPRPHIDLDFHRAVAAASVNDHYVRAIDVIDYDIDTGIVLAERLDQIGQSERRRAIFCEHSAIVAAIRDQDPDGAAWAMTRHLDFSQARVIARGTAVGGGAPVS